MPAAGFFFKADINKNVFIKCLWKSKFSCLLKLGDLATAQTSTSQSAGEKAVHFWPSEHQRFCGRPAVDQRDDVVSHPQLASHPGHPASRRMGFPGGVLHYSRTRTSTFWTQSRLYVLREEHSINWAKLQRASVGTLGRPPNSERASHHAHPFPKHGFEGTLDVSALQMTTVQRTSELRDLIRPLRMRRKGWESLER